MVMKNIYLALAALALSSVTANADGLVEGDAEAGQSKSITCAACHGQYGAADGPAAADTVEDPIVLADAGYMFNVRSDVLYAKIRRGGMGTDMPNFGTLLTQEETWALVDYLWTFPFESTVE